MVLAHDDYFAHDLSLTRGAPAGRVPTALRAELLSLRSSVLLTPHDVHSFLGYSYHFGQYWQYKSSERGTVWSSSSRLSATTLRGYKPLGFVLSTLCEASGGAGNNPGGNNPGGSRAGGGGRDEPVGVQAEAGGPDGEHR